MKISRISNNNYKPAFRANFSQEAEFYFRQLGKQIIDNYGTNQKEYRNFSKFIQQMKKLCPKWTIDVNIHKDCISGSVENNRVFDKSIYELCLKKGEEKIFLETSAYSWGRTFTLQRLPEYIEIMKQIDNPGYKPINKTKYKVLDKLFG